MHHWFGDQRWSNPPLLTSYEGCRINSSFAHKKQLYRISLSYILVPKALVGKNIPRKKQSKNFIKEPSEKTDRNSPPHLNRMWDLFQSFTGKAKYGPPKLSPKEYVQHRNCKTSIGNNNVGIRENVKEDAISSWDCSII